MNSSTKFILSQLNRIKLPLIGYFISIFLFAAGTLIFHSLNIYPNPFKLLLAFTATFAPYVILTLAVLNFFSFRSHKGLAQFFTMLPVLKRKQITLNYIVLFILALCFSIIISLTHLFFHSININTEISGTLLYILSLFFFVSVISFLKLLLVHNRAFFIALFLFFICFWMSAPLSNVSSYSAATLIPWILSLALIAGSCFYLIVAIYLYNKEETLHKTEKTKNIATIIFYTTILTPVLYILYSNIIFARPPYNIQIIVILLFILFAVAICILKITLNKIKLLTLFLPFLIAHCVSIPLIPFVSHIQSQYYLQKWESSHFIHEDNTSLYLYHSTLFGHTRNIHIQHISQLDKTLLDSLHEDATLHFHDNPSTLMMDTTIDQVSLENELFTITWKSDTHKDHFSKQLEKSIQTLDQQNYFDVNVDFQDNERNCSLSSSLTPVCSEQQTPLSTQPPSYLSVTNTSIEKSLSTIDSLHTSSYSIHALSTNGSINISV